MDQTFLDTILRVTKDYWFLITLIASVVLTAAYMVVFRINPWDAQRAIKLTRDRVRFHNGVGYSLIESGHFTEALSEFEESLKLSAEDQTALNGRYLSNLFISLDSPVSDPSVGIAIQRHISETDALRREQHLHLIEKYLGDLHLRIGNVVKADEHYKAALKYKPDYPHALSALGWHYYNNGIGGVEETELIFRKLTEVAPYDYRGFHGLGYTLYMKALREADVDTRTALIREAADQGGRAKDLVYTQLNIVMDFGEIARSVDPSLSLYFHDFGKKIMTNPDWRDNGENKFPIFARFLMSEGWVQLDGKDDKLAWIDYQRALDYLAMERRNDDLPEGDNHDTYFARAQRLDSKKQVYNIYKDQLQILDLLLPKNE